jgi:transaldolase
MAHAPSLEDLRVKIFSDGADLESMLALSKLSYIAGFTTNPTLMRKAGVTDYEQFAREILAAIQDRPISFEVTSDDFSEMERQARKIASWAPNVYVKIPVTNTRGEMSLGLIRRLAGAQIPLNVTAILTLDQVRDVSAALEGETPSCMSVFAGRIADTGRDPVPVMAAALDLMRPYGNQELIWRAPASC